jgi:hypothetical protein
MNTATRPSARYRMDTCYYNNKIFLKGGFVDDATVYNDFWYFDLDENMWYEVTTENASKIYERYGSLTVYNNYMYQVYGRDAQVVAPYIEKFNLDTADVKVKIPLVE